MAKPVTERMVVLDHVIARLELIAGGDDWNLDLRKLKEKVHRKVTAIETITPDQLPYLAVFATEGAVRPGMGGWYDGDFNIEVIGLMKDDEHRFRGIPADVGVEMLLADVRKTITAAVQEPTTQCYTKQPWPIEKDFDEELGRWSLFRLTIPWIYPQAQRGR